MGIGEWISPERMDEPVVIILAIDAPRMVLVADGLGGHAEGARASRATVEFLLRGASCIADRERLAQHVRQANAAIYDTMRRVPAWAGMGTTVAGLLIAPSRCVACNVGDSGVYVERGGFLRQLSEDDTRPRSSGVFDPLRAAPGAGVIQAIGGHGTFVEIEPHLVETHVAHGQTFLICSDGLTGAVELEELEAGLARSDDAVTIRGWFAAAMRAGARDNLSVVLARISSAAVASGSR
jgi:PPM family protein phosphatase